MQVIGRFASSRRWLAGAPLGGARWGQNVILTTAKRRGEIHVRIFTMENPKRTSRSHSLPLCSFNEADSSVERRCV